MTPRILPYFLIFKISFRISTADHCVLHIDLAEFQVTYFKETECEPGF